MNGEEALKEVINKLVACKEEIGKGIIGQKNALCQRL